MLKFNNIETSTDEPGLGLLFNEEQSHVTTLNNSVVLILAMFFVVII